MTSHLFSDLLKSFYKKLKIAGRKALLLLDNCSSHRGFDVEYDEQKTNLHVAMLPQNTTAKLQPSTVVDLVNFCCIKRPTKLVCGKAS